jgi:hypothetical protein
MPRSSLIARPLSAAERGALHPYIPGVDLEAARILDGKVPWYLLRGFAAITRGTLIYFRPGVYAADTIDGLALLAHELVHVGQYREGMNALTYLCSTWRGYACSRYEIAAFAMQRRVAAGLLERSR